MVPRMSIDQMVDRVIERERIVVAQMQHLHPIAETYIQNLKTDHDSMVVPSSDQYFLGRLDLSDGVGDQLFEKADWSEPSRAESVSRVCFRASFCR